MCVLLSHFQHWSGLVGDYYYTRWQMFLSAEVNAAVTGVPFNDITLFANILEFEEVPLPRRYVVNLRRQSLSVHVYSPGMLRRMSIPVLPLVTLTPSLWKCWGSMGLRPSPPPSPPHPM